MNLSQYRSYPLNPRMRMRDKMDKSDAKRIVEQIEEYVKQTTGYIDLTEEYVARTGELMGEIFRRLKIIDDVAMTLEKYPDIIDDKKALDDIRSIMKRTLEARSYAKTLSSKEDRKDE